MSNDEVERVKQELEHARKRIAELEARLASELQPRNTPAWLHHALETAGIGVWEWDVARDKVTWNNAIFQIHGLTSESFGGDLTSIRQPILEEDRPLLDASVQRALTAGQPYQIEFRIRRPDGTIRWVLGQGQAELDEAGKPRHLAGTLQDITERKLAMEERLVIQQKIIDAQRVTLRELGAPIIPLADQTLAVPLVGELTRERAEQVNEMLLQAVRESSTQTVLLDVTGVPNVDVEVAQALVRAAQAARLLGADVVLTGVRPQVAQILVDLGIDMHNFVIKANLQSGLEYVARSKRRAASSIAGPSRPHA
jgi:rsbT co-antagonist protein RsbR